MGVGDVKLALFMGLFLGWPHILVALFIAFLLGSIVGVFLVLNKNKSLSSEVPFGPFLVVGTLIAIFEAENIINWYLNLFLIQ
jgi:leader peptidase (prepilin peptidase)/N-methyltransferase